MLSPISLLPLLSGLTLAVITPVKQSDQLIANFTDSRYNRDSCTSSKLGDREFWTCRDTQTTSGGFFTSTASWTDFYSNGIPKFVGSNLLAYGNNDQNFFTAPSRQGFDSNGFSTTGDGTRYVGWPDTRGLPMQYYGGAWFVYTWILNVHLQGLTSLNGPPYSCALYRNYFNNVDSNDLPSVTLINANFVSLNLATFL